MKLGWTCALLTGFVLATPTVAQAQLFYVGVRGGAVIPTGRFSETEAGASDPFLQGAASGLGYGVDAGTGAGLLGLYASIDRIQFECADDPCGFPGRYKLVGMAAGLRLGIPLFPIVKPWVKGGVVVNDLTGTLSGNLSNTKVETVRRPGYEVGGGIDIPVAGIFSITPQIRHVRQRLKYRVIPGPAGQSSAKDVNYYTFDIGFRLRSPI